MSAVGNDEFATLASGFNGMAEHLESMYRNLEGKGVERRHNEEKRSRLEAPVRCHRAGGRCNFAGWSGCGFIEQVARVVHADGAALRWSDEDNQKYVMLASVGLPTDMAVEEHCLMADQCQCGMPSAPPGARVIPIRADQPTQLPHCEKAGFSTVVLCRYAIMSRFAAKSTCSFMPTTSCPRRSGRCSKRSRRTSPPPWKTCVLARWSARPPSLRNATFSPRATRLDRAVTRAFLKMQVQLLRDAQTSGDRALIAQVVGEIDEGVRESYSDVRELLLHFRTRASEEDIEPALQTTLRKFEHQSGIRTALSMQGTAFRWRRTCSCRCCTWCRRPCRTCASTRGQHACGSTQQQPQWRFEARQRTWL